MTDMGRVKTTNQDAFRCDPKAGLFVIADGISGHAAGDLAAEHTVQLVADLVAASEGLVAEVAAQRADSSRLAELLRAAMERASGELYAQAQVDLAKRGMGCTC